MPVPVVIVSSDAGPRTAHAMLQLAGGSPTATTAVVLPGRDARLAANPAVHVVRTRPQDVVLGEGCACCTVRADLLKRIRGLAADGRTDRILVHAPPGDDLQVIAKTFTVADATGATLEGEATLDGLVVVARADTLAALRPDRALVERIELATVVLLDPEGADDAARARAARVVRALHPAARVAWADEAALVVGAAAGDAGFDLGGARSRAALQDVHDGTDLRGDTGVSRVVFQARRPFDAARLHAWLGALPAGLLRASGGFWVATRPHVAANLDIAGPDARTGMEGHWWAAVPPDQRPTGPQWDFYMSQVWHPDFGDRRQELAFVGIDLDEDALRRGLEACLLDAAALSDPGAWATAPHPFAWPTEEAR